MLNKNVADYTNFQGKTNKKIVQAPGGASSISLAWNNDKSDYYKPSYNSSNHISNLGAAGSSIGKSTNDIYGHAPMNNNHSDQSINKQMGYGYGNGVAKNYGGQHGYNNYNSNLTNPGSYKYALDLQMKLNNSNKVLSHLSGNSNSNLQNYGYHAGSNNLINQQINSINYGLKPTVMQQYSYGNGSSGGSVGGSGLYGNGYSNAGYSSGSYSGYGQSSGTQKNIEQLDLAYNQQYHKYSPAGEYPPSKNKSYSVHTDISHQLNSPYSAHSKQSNHSEYQYRPSVKINGPPPQQFKIGSDYNYWKDQEPDDIGRSGGKKLQSEKRIAAQRERRKERERERDREMELGYENYEERGIQRTSVKVNNPPGGKQSLILG